MHARFNKSYISITLDLFCLILISFLIRYLFVENKYLFTNVK